MAKKTSEVEVMVVAGEKNPTICGECIRLCEAIIEEKEMKDVPFCRVPGKKYRQPREKLRPITRIPTGWHICETDLYASEPYVAACSPNGKKHTDFAIPKPLAWWMISNDEKLDVDELREKITKHINYVVWQTLMTY